jgi:uncharacterized protein (TIGR02594 family)
MNKFLLVTYIFIGLTFQSLAAVSKWNEFRIGWNYSHNKYERSTQLAKKALRKDGKNGFVHYCLGMSLYHTKRTQNKINHIVDNILGHLTFAVKQEDSRIKTMMVADTSALRELKEKAIEITKSEFVKFPSKSLKRVQTIIAIYGDSIEIYREFEVQRTELEKSQAAITQKLEEQKMKRNSKKEIKSIEKTSPMYTVEKTSVKNLTDTIEQYCGRALTDQQKKVLSTALSYNMVGSYSTGNNPKIMRFFHQTGFQSIKNDEVNWCAAFVNYCMEEIGVTHPHSLLAKDWLKVGTPVKEPQPGDIVIFWRGKEKGWQGHVGFFIKADKEKNLIYVFGGNQDGAVCLKPFGTERVLGYRRIIM